MSVNELFKKSFLRKKTSFNSNMYSKLLHLTLKCSVFFNEDVFPFYEAIEDFQGDIGRGKFIWRSARQLQETSKKYLKNI